MNEVRQIQFQPLDLEPPLPSLRTLNFRMALLGSAGCGKTSLALRFLQRDPTGVKPTIGADLFKIAFKGHNLLMHDVNIVLGVVDTAGMERYDAVNAQSVRGVEYCCLVFALDDEQSFNALTGWREFLLRHSPQCDIILVGNKCDAKRVVEMKQINEFIAANGIDRYVECSALVGYSIKPILAGQLWADSIRPRTGIQKKKDTGCC